MPKKKSDPAWRGGVTDGDTVNVPIQKKEGDTRLVLTVRASELTLDRGDVAASSTIEFRCLRTDVARTGKLQLTHALAGGEREKLHTNVWTKDVGTPPQKAVRLWMVSFKKYDKERNDGTQTRDWRRRCSVPDALKEAFALRRDVENLETVAGRSVIASEFTPRLLPNAYMFLCDLKNWEDQLRLDHGGWSEAEAWNNARDQVIANAATGLNNMESSPLFLWLPDNHKENARNSLEHKWIGWNGVETTADRLVLPQSRKWRCLHNDVFHYCACSMA